MGILRRLREWREDADGTLKGPALKTEQVSINESFKGDGLSLSNDPDNPTKLFVLEGTDVINAAIEVNDTQVIADNTPTDITLSRLGIIPAGVFYVYLSEDGDSDVTAIDIVQVAEGRVENVIDAARDNIPRSYNHSGGMLQLAIDDDGQTFNVGVWGFGGDAT